jgi:hypothetical protein
MKTELSPGKLRVVIALAGDVRDVVTNRWTGVFLSDGKPIAGTEFKIHDVRAHSVEAVLDGTTLPSEVVRLYEPGGRR